VSIRGFLNSYGQDGPETSILNPGRSSAPVDRRLLAIVSSGILGERSYRRRRIFAFRDYFPTGGNDKAGNRLDRLVRENLFGKRHDIMLSRARSERQRGEYPIVPAPVSSVVLAAQ
jgi:hypothetical protein